MTRPLRFLFPATVTEEAFAAAGEGNGWHFLGPQKGEGHPGFEYLWATPDRETFISWVEDYTLGLRYLAVHGANREQVAETLTRSIPVIGKNDLLQMVRPAKTRDEKVAAVYAIAAFANEPDPEIVAELQNAFDDEEADVRRAAIIAALYSEWRELHPLLTRLIDSDPDSQVREMAAVALENLQKHT